jgi:UDP-2,4-diacetamido-2,4,6-trideoxy-beta-L-altropyranose hydrolase
MALVVFRADGGPAIGAGHVMRCLALARAFAAGGWRVGFAAGRETFASVRALAGAAVEPLMLDVDNRHPKAGEEAAALARRWPDGADVLIVDHYGRDASFESACRGWAKRIVVIDDLADRPHDADILVDVATPPAAYRGLLPETCELLTGPDHAIVDSAFRAMRGHALARRCGAEVRRVLVSFGQVDASNVTQRALAALAAAGFDGEVDVVLGHAAPHLDAVRAAAGPRTRLHVDAGNMPALMAGADLAIGAGGVTALERCCLGLPSVLVTVADNQRRIVAMLEGAGAAVDAGGMDGGLGTRLAGAITVLFSDAPRRAAMADAGAKLVDGLGGERIMLAAVGPVTAKDGHPVRLRPATAADEAWLLELQSQPQTRRYSNDPSPPTPEGHREWLVQTLADPSYLLMIASMEGSPVGMLRLDRKVHGDRVNIAVDSRYHRCGIGAAMLALAAKLRSGRVLDAEILPGNAASRALFAGAGYRQIGERLFRREPA